MMTEAEIRIMIDAVDITLSEDIAAKRDTTASLAYRRLLIDWLIGVQLKNFDRN
jgi:hypothetical protein